MIWRELVDRGGKGVLIGGANEFQEYAWGYYGIKSQLYTSDVTKVRQEHFAFIINVVKALYIMSSFLLACKKIF